MHLARMRKCTAPYGWRISAIGRYPFWLTMTPTIMTRTIMTLVTAINRAVMVMGRIASTAGCIHRLRSRYPVSSFSSSAGKEPRGDHQKRQARENGDFKNQDHCLGDVKSGTSLRRNS